MLLNEELFGKLSEGKEMTSRAPDIGCAISRTGGVRHRCFVKVSRARHKDGEGERWAMENVCPTLNLFDLCGDTRIVTAIVKQKG